MKTMPLTALPLLGGPARAAIVIAGIGVTNVKNNDGLTNIPAGTLGLVVVDAVGDGFFNFGNPAGNSTLTPVDCPALVPSEANLSIGSTFGGEIVLNILSAPSAGRLSTFVLGQSIEGLENKNFAVVWFSGILAASAPTTAPVGTYWGVIRGSDWTLPRIDAGNYTMSPTDAVGAATFYQVNALSGGGQSTAFRSTTNSILGAASILIVPEISSLSLGALGVLSLFLRNRNIS